MISPEVVYGFSQVFPAVRVTQIVANQETLMEKLRTMEIDIALTYDLYTKEDVAFESLAQLPPHVMVGEFHPLAQKSAVTLEELAEYPMIMLDVPESNAYFMSLFLNQELQPHIAARSADFDVVRAMVANHMGYALCNVRPKSNQSLDGRRLVRIRLAGQHRPMRLGMATYKAINTSRLLNAFIQRCRAYVSDHYIPGMSAPRYCDPRMISPEKTESTEDKVLAA
jgi:DNA-binding transcriptional LysR family regulator